MKNTAYEARKMKTGVHVDGTSWWRMSIHSGLARENKGQMEENDSQLIIWSHGLNWGSMEKEKKKKRETQIENSWPRDTRHSLVRVVWRVFYLHWIFSFR